MTPEAGWGGARAGGRWILLTGVVLAVLIASAYGGTLGLELTGDDYEWAQWAHRALHSPRLLLAPFGFFRPTNTVTLALDRLLWSTDPAGYRLSNLVFHWAAAVLLVLVGIRYRLPRGVALAAGAIWSVSPLASEAVLSISVRHDSHLLIGWCLLLLVWPLAGRRWTIARTAAVAASLLLAMASKEVWVVTPALVLAAALVASGFRWRAALPHAAWCTLLVGLYLVVHAVWMPAHPGYLKPGLGAAAKAGNAAAAFIGLSRLRPAGFELDWAAASAAVVIVALALWVLRRRSPAGVVGLTLLVASPLPTLLVPFQPLRYVAAPYAGFLLLVAAAVVEVVGECGARWRLAAATAAAVWAVGVVLGGSGLRAGEIEDARAISAAHGELLTEARAVAGQLRAGEPIAMVRGERWFPLGDVLDRPRGLGKAYYLRSSDPYGLIDGAALLDWVLDDPSLVVIRVDDWRRRYAGVSGRVLVHRRGGFQWAGGAVTDLAAAAEGWASSGLPVRVVLAVAVE